MLNKYEIENIAKEKGEDAKIIEKDYLLDMLLFLISQEDKKNLILKGGTALYKFYSLNRFSEDLDFTLNRKIDINKIIKKIITKLRQSGISARIKDSSTFKNQRNIRLELRGPLFDGNPQNANVITINISMKEKTIYKPSEERLYPKYKDIPFFTVSIMPLEEILSEKIRALFTRDKARDVYDIWFLVGKGIMAKKDDINKKLKIYNQKFNKKKFIDKIEEKRRLWEVDLRGLIKGDLPDFNKVKIEILKNFERI